MLIAVSEQLFQNTNMKEEKPTHRGESGAAANEAAEGQRTAPTTRTPAAEALESEAGCTSSAWTGFT
ncbi:hypothetical protein EYF80_057287 [Liparis tanakae]|uniref:Uncharacterized protein n=1 Tax=Liparis tanakae TaxID=230148 RepID=A0A4Z2EW14_9TELE|nr:hypothetical protein EYF80_057287 [Liparis tanakae]